MINNNEDAIGFTLDNTTGYEIHYAITSVKPFHFETDIRPPLPQLSGQFSQQWVYFKHLTK